MLDQKASHLASGVTRVEKAKIGVIQFCISPPKTDVSSVTVLCVFVLGYVFLLVTADVTQWPIYSPLN